MKMKLVVFVLLLISSIFTPGCSGSEASENAGDSLAIITDCIGLEWDVSHARDVYDMNPVYYNYGLGVGAIPSVDNPVVIEEGAFLWCSFWLVRNFIRLGRVEEATELYEKLFDYSNHLGLLSEMVDPVSGELLGNFPQALTHLAVIVAGLELTEALKEKKSGR